MSIFSLFLFFSCGSDENKQAATYGKCKFGSEKSLKYIVDAEVKTFEYFYNDADLTAVYTNERDLMQGFLNDTFKLVISYRDFDSTEKKYLLSKKITPYTTIIGLEGMTLIVNPESADTSITVDQFIQLLKGSGDSIVPLQKKWKDIVFDEKGGAGLRYADSLIGKQKLSERCFTLNSQEETIDFVAKNKNAIGVISYDLIADTEDPRAMANKNKIRALCVSADGKEYFKPCQRNFVNWKYPFVRKIFMHTSDYNGSLAMGFVSYVSSDDGQLIIRRGGLLPARLAWRDMNVVFEPMNVK
ncbi:MAG: substrate-binding domain-containing protein [Bacteroidia bacterium]|nr:substrate-binding domain-containing protein [Bacteroidia bacterium]